MVNNVIVVLNVLNRQNMRDGFNIELSLAKIGNLSETAKKRGRFSRLVGDS